MNTSTHSDSCGLQGWGACLLTGSHWALRMRESNSYSAHCLCSMPALTIQRAVCGNHIPLWHLKQDFA